MLTYEQKQAAEEALHWALKHIGEGTFWHERHYPALRAALDAVPFEAMLAAYVLSGLDAPAGTPGAGVPAGTELVSTANAASDVSVVETPEPADEPPADTPKKGKGK